MLWGDQAKEKLRYPSRELSSDIAKRYRIFGKKVEVKAMRKACRKKVINTDIEHIFCLIDLASHEKSPAVENVFRDLNKF